MVELVLSHPDFGFSYACSIHKGCAKKKANGRCSLEGHMEIRENNNSSKALRCLDYKKKNSDGGIR